MNLSTETRSRFQELIYATSSLHFTSSRLANLENRLKQRVARLGLASFEDYYKVIERNGVELNNLINCITTKETYFFRLPGQFRALEEMVIPELEHEASDVLAGFSRAKTALPGGRLPLEIWSAGCATGEEPYSIAMALSRSLRYHRIWRTRILATDISEDALVRAERGVYEGRVTATIPEACKRLYTTRSGQGVAINDEVKRLVEFRTFNLRALEDVAGAVHYMEDLAGRSRLVDLAGAFDVIMCRNVMIYFDLPAQQALVDNLYHCLRPGGWLFTGDAELLHIYDHRYETIEYGGAYFYRRPLT